MLVTPPPSALQFLPRIYGDDDEFVALQCSFILFRLLMQYVDPELCQHLDQVCDTFSCVPFTFSAAKLRVCLLAIADDPFAPDRDFIFPVVASGGEYPGIVSYFGSVVYVHECYVRLHVSMCVCVCAHACMHMCVCVCVSFLTVGPPARAVRDALAHHTVRPQPLQRPRVPSVCVCMYVCICTFICVCA